MKYYAIISWEREGEAWWYSLKSRAASLELSGIFGKENLEKSFNHGEAKFFWNNRSGREEGNGWRGGYRGEAGRPINWTEVAEEDEGWETKVDRLTFHRLNICLIGDQVCTADRFEPTNGIKLKGSESRRFRSNETHETTRSVESSSRVE